MSISAEDLAKKFGGTVISADELAKKFGGTVKKELPPTPPDIQSALDNQRQKHPTAAEKPPLPYGLDYAWKLAKGMGGELKDYLTEEAPSMAGAVVGGIAGAPGGPPGIVAGGAIGAALGREAQLAYRAKYGDVDKVPSTPGAILKDVAGKAASGALQESGPAVKVLAKLPMQAMESAAPELLHGISGAAEAVPKRFLIRPSTTLTPENKAAIDLGTSAGVPMDAGLRSGNRSISGLKENIRYLPGAAGVIQKKEAEAATKMGTLGDKIISSVGPSTDQYGTGLAIRNDVRAGISASNTAESAARDEALTSARDLMGPAKTTQQLMEDLKTAKLATGQANEDTSNAAYQAFRDVANHPDNAAQVQTGMKSGMAETATGSMEPGEIPVYETIHSPVDLTKAKAQLQDIFDKLSSSSNTVIRDASPGYQALKAFMQLPDQISADQAIREVSALGKVGFSGAFKDFPSMADVSAGVAKKAWGAARDALDATATKIKALDSLNAGRAAAKEGFDTFGTQLARGTAQSAETKPIAALISDLNITNVDSLLKQTGGKELPAIRRAIFDSMQRKATTNGVVDAEKLAGQWDKLGPEVKAKIFTPQQISAMDAATAPQMLYGPAHPVTHFSDLLTKEPTAVFDSLTKLGDKSAETLEKFGIAYPNRIPQLGRATLESLNEQSPDAAFAAWNKFGPKTKTLLVGGDTKKLADIDAFFRLRKMLAANLNKSQTAPFNVTRAYGTAALGAVGNAVLRPGLESIAAVPIVVAGVPLAARVAAKILYSDGGAKLLTQGMQAPIGSKLAQSLASKIMARSAGAALPAMPKDASSPPPPLSANAAKTPIAPQPTANAAQQAVPPPVTAQPAPSTSTTGVRNGTIWVKDATGWHDTGKKP